MNETKPLAQNRKAHYDYTITDTFEAGMVLTGTEIKSIRQAKIQLKDGFIRVTNGQAWLTNVYIAPFDHGNRFNVEERRTRKLLLRKSEIKQLEKEVSGAGVTIVPLKVYIKNGYAKLLLGVAKGKKNYDKRESLKRKEQKRDIARELKDRNN